MQSQKKRYEGSLSVVFLKEDEHWIAQCLEYDIVGQSRSLKNLPEAFALAFASHIAVRMEAKQDLFEGVPPAPDKYWALFEQGIRLDEKDVRVPIPSLNTPPPFLDARVAEVA